MRKRASGEYAKCDNRLLSKLGRSLRDTVYDV
jgi:hypothetical protein